MRKLIKLIIAFVLVFMANVAIAAETGDLDSLLNVLDQTIKNKSIYNDAKEARIDTLKKRLTTTDSDEHRYHIYRDLFNEYRIYNIDSALYVAQKRLEASEKLNMPRRINTSKMNIADIMSVAGMYKETLDILNSIPRSTLEDNQFSYYYHLYHSIYTLMGSYAFGENERSRYNQLALGYKDSLMMVNDPNSLGYLIIKSDKFLKEGNYKQAFEVVNSTLEKYGKNVETRPMLACTLAELYQHEGNTELEKKYLAIASIADIKSANKEYISLRKLASILFQEGDVERAHAYIKCAMEDATACRATFRMLETSEVLPLIVSAYDLKMEEEKERLYNNLVVITILSLLLIIAIVFIYIQLSKIRTNRESIKQMNGELRTINEDLVSLNKRLLESNHVKEEYIGYVFNMCSTYINKLDSYRKNINRKLKLKQVDEVLQITGSYSLESDELKEFFHNFDTVFINLYPNFITEFNSLLQNDEQIVPKDDEILTPELRIYALIRLGITDSTKIAKFLGYSPQTVYNYRLKIRNKSILPKEDFNEAVQKIGFKE